jgi:hypothetical protein
VGLPEVERIENHPDVEIIQLDLHQFHLPFTPF